MAITFSEKLSRSEMLFTSPTFCSRVKRMRWLEALNFLCIHRQENIKFSSSINWSKNGLSRDILIGMLLTIQPRFLEQDETVKVELYFHIHYRCVVVFIHTVIISERASFSLANWQRCVKSETMLCGAQKWFQLENS